MAHKLLQNIDARLKKLNKTDAGASKEAGLSETFIKDMRRKRPNPNVESLTKLADALDTTPGQLLEGNLESEEEFTLDNFPNGHTEPRGLPIVGVIQAGVFRDITVQSQDEEYETVDMWKDKRFPNARQYALLVSGDSMNEIYPDGVYVICVDFIESGLQLNPGNVVHVERTIAGKLVEATLKELQIHKGKPILVPRSTNPIHKPLQLTGGEDTAVYIRGIVIGEWRPVVL